MKNKILAVSLLSVFAFSFVVAGASAETRAEKKIREAREKVEKRVEKKITNKMATSTNATSTSSVSSSGRATTTQVALECIGNAVGTREESIMSAQETFSASIKTALQTRKDALRSAWNNTNAKERKTAVKSVWNNFKTGSKTAVNALKDSRKSAWSAFETARKNCKGGASEDGLAEENEGKGIDMSVSN